MVDFTIPDLTAIAARLNEATLFEVHRSGQTASEKATGTEMRRLMGDGVPYVVNNWYASLDPGGSLPVSHSPFFNRIYLSPFIPRQTITVLNVGADISNAVAASNIQIAIYGSSNANLPTGNALSSTGNISAATLGSVTAALGATVTLEAGKLYWFAVNADTANANIYGHNSCGLFQMAVGLTTAALGTTALMSTFFIAQTFGTWPDLTAAGFTAEQACPRFKFQVASIL